MTKRRLTELVSKWPVGDVDADLASSFPELSTDPQEVPGYVRPRVTELRHDKGSRIAILTAPGAVGKSAAARWIASNRGWFLVDSARIQVGDHGMTGLLRKAFGKSAKVFSMIEDGKVGFVIDALDEALIRSNVDNLFGFIEDIVSLSTDQPRSSVNTVLVAREDVADLLLLKLDDMGESCQVIRLDFFDHEGALQMLGMARSGGPLDAPSRDLAEDRMCSISSALLGEQVTNLPAIWSQVEGFLGYAPVLGILAESLDVDNPYRELMSGQAFSSGQILIELIRTLLEREHEKFVDAKASELLARSPVGEIFEAKNLYTPAEQIRRLYANVSGVHFQRSQSPVSDTIWPLYDEAATQWFLDHPFSVREGVAGQVFRDFVLAETSKDSTVAIRNDVGVVAPGRFFATFMYELCAGRAPEWLVPWLIDSTNDVALERGWIFSQRGDVAILRLPDPLASGVLEFAIEDLSGLLELGLSGVVGGGTVITDQGVRLTGSPNLLVTSGLYVFAEYIYLAAGGVQVTPPGTVLFARVDADAAGVTSLNQVGQAWIETLGFDQWPLFHGYRSSLGQEQIGTAYRAAEGFADLRSLLRGFRKSVHDRRPTLSGARMQQIVGHNSRRDLYLSQLLDWRVIDSEGSAYYVRQEALSERGISFDSLCRGNLDDGILKLLIDLESELKD